MLLETEGLVLSAVKYGESSLITKVFTEANGLISIISSRPKGKSRGSKSHLFQMPYSLVKLIVYYKDSQQIHRVKEIQFASSYKEDLSHIVKISIRYFIAELLSKIIVEEEQNPGLYFLLKKECLQLNSSEKVDSHFLLNFLCSLIEELGFLPNLNYNNNYFDLSNGEFQDKSHVENAFLNQAESLLLYEAFLKKRQLNRVERNQTLNNLLSYLSHQLNQELKLKSKDVLETIFS